MTKQFGALALACLLLAACDDAKPSASARQSPSNADKYSRDREYCRAQVNEQMRTRRSIDDSRRDTYAGDDDRMGRGQLSSQMANYSDTRIYDKLMASCLESRGYAQPKQDWWQRFGTPHAL